MYIVHSTAERKKANWIGRLLLRNCLRKHVIYGKTEGEKKGKTRKTIIKREDTDTWKRKH